MQAAFMIFSLSEFVPESLPQKYKHTQVAHTHTNSTLFRGYVYGLHQTLTQSQNQMLCWLNHTIKKDILFLWQNTMSKMRVLLTGKYYRLLTFGSNLTWGHQTSYTDQIISYSIFSVYSVSSACLSKYYISMSIFKYVCPQYTVFHISSIITKMLLWFYILQLIFPHAAISCYILGSINIPYIPSRDATKRIQLSHQLPLFLQHSLLHYYLIECDFILFYKTMIMSFRPQRPWGMEMAHVNVLWVTGKCETSVS